MPYQLIARYIKLYPPIILSFCRGLLAAMLLATAANTVCADTGQATADNRIQVATRESPPFSFKDPQGIWRGLSIDLWEQIAASMGVQFDYVEYDALPDLLDAVADGKAGVAAAALTITSERENRMDFSHPFISSQLGILSIPSRESAWLTLLKVFFSAQFFFALFSLSLVLLVSGAAVYFFERKRNPDQFCSQTLPGLGDAFWWSAVTMTTVGYGDKAPVTLGGRLVALVWMFMSVIILSTFTASIVSALALERDIRRIESAHDLRPGRVGTLAGSTSDTYLQHMHLKPVYADSIPQLLKLLKEGRIEAIVYDTPILDYYLREEPPNQFSLSAIFLQRQDYGFALTQGSPLRQDINIALLRFLNDFRWQEIKDRYGISK